MKKFSKYHGILFSLNRYLTFFLLIAFVITCCMMLFVSTMANTLNIELTNSVVNAAAKLTFINVIFLSVIYTVIDIIK